MRNVAIAIALLLGLFSTAAFGVDVCAVPAADSGEPYVTLSGMPKRELRLMLDEYTFLQRWTKHSEALSAGFRPGDRVYGEILKNGRKFDARKVAAWRRNHEKSGHVEFVDSLGAKVDMATVDAGVVQWTHRCLDDNLWSRIRVIDACRFEFAAGLLPDATRPRVRALRFEVHGARCGSWPKRPLSIKGDAVQCARNDDGAVTLELVTDEAGPAREALSPLSPVELPPEPSQERRLSEPASEVIKLSRLRDYSLRQLGRGCPTCKLYSADIRPSDSNATILRATTVSSNGEGWQRCPAGLRCGVYEFSPPDNPQLSGCEERPACRVWRLAETDTEASDVIQLIYQTLEVVCVNCPNGMAFELAHRRWQEIRDTIRRPCERLADSPVKPMTRE